MTCTYDGMRTHRREAMHRRQMPRQATQLSAVKQACITAGLGGRVGWGRPPVRGRCPPRPPAAAGRATRLSSAPKCLLPYSPDSDSQFRLRFHAAMRCDAMTLPRSVFFPVKHAAAEKGRGAKSEEKQGRKRACEPFLSAERVCVRRQFVGQLEGLLRRAAEMGSQVGSGGYERERKLAPGGNHSLVPPRGNEGAARHQIHVTGCEDGGERARRHPALRPRTAHSTAQPVSQPLTHCRTLSHAASRGF